MASRCGELKRYSVSKLAHDRGYGSAEEIVPARREALPRSILLIKSTAR